MLSIKYRKSGILIGGLIRTKYNRSLGVLDLRGTQKCCLLWNISLWDTKRIVDYLWGTQTNDVILCKVPQQMVQFIKEIGRVGRGGSPAHALS